MYRGNERVQALGPAFRVDGPVPQRTPVVGAAGEPSIVEDEPLIAMMLEDFLEVLDRRVAGTADSVATALAQVEKGGVEAAILDLNLRGGEKSTPIAEALAANGRAVESALAMLRSAAEKSPLLARAMARTEGN